MSFLIKSKNIERDGYIWNMLATTIMAFQSVILLMILTRVIGLADAGIFTLAFANANLLLNIGKYGVHNYQVSDTKPMFTFGDYRASRWITTVAMLVASVIYVLVYAATANQPTEKLWIMLWMCFFKTIDAMEDVYFCLYQQKGRLDIAGKLMTVRLILTVLFFIACLLIFRSLLVTLILSTVFTILVFLLLNIPCRACFKEEMREKPNGRRVWSLMLRCAPLFLIFLLSFYLTNAPKYPIDRFLSDEAQACYGFISMPVFVVGLMGNFLFNPMIRPLSDKWEQKEIGWFGRQMLKQALIVTGITVVCVVGAYWIGIPVLSLLYGTDLGAYRGELLVLLASSGFLALSNQLMTALTIVRRQTRLLIGYGACSVLALVMAPMLVRRYEMMGAALLELIIMFALCVLFVLMLLREMRKAKRS